MTKICSECNTEKDDSDFYGSNICYKCIYRMKNPKPIKKKAKVILCKECGKELSGARWVYCSDKCCADAKKIKDKNYWLRHVKADRVLWNS